MKISAIIAAAGSSKRMGSKVNKPYINIKGLPILCYSIVKFLKIQRISEVIVIIRKKDEKICHYLIKKYKFKNVKTVFGGKVRQDSVFNGLKAVRKDCKIVLIHDAARPFVSKELINNLIKNAIKFNAAIPVLPIKETVKRSSNGNFIDATLDRNKLFLAQTPQVFDYKLILNAYEKAYKENVCSTDDAMLVERLGNPVKIVLGEEKNIKITTKHDLNKLSNEH